MKLNLHVFLVQILTNVRWILMVVTKTTGIALTLLGPMIVAVTLGTLVMDSTATVSSLYTLSTVFHMFIAY